MKRYQTANRLFLASTILFGAAVILQHASPWSGSEAVSIFYFLAQSCLIGCCADWIAVEALFRRRFHLPYKPLIPSNQDAVIRKLSAVSDSLIDKTGLLKGALGGSVMELADREFFHNEKVREAAESFLAREGARFLTGLVSENKEKAASLADGETGKVISLIAGKAREEILARMSREEWLQKLLALVGEKAKTAGAKEALAGAIKKAGEEQKQQAGFFKRLLFSAAELTGTVDYEEMAETGLAALGAAIERWKRPEDPFHQTLLARWDEAIHAFVDDKETKDALEDFGKSLFKKYPAGEKVRTIIDSLLSEWNEDENGKTKLENTLHGFAGSAIDRLAADSILRGRIDSGARDLIAELADHERTLLAGAAVSVLKSLSSEELNEFIESKVHTDLEGIRINGAITGLAAGGLFYFLLEYAYIPFMHQFM
ncbi:DUF445 family protein [uncultured Dialister sp.]|jgi:uncharacterized membrane-anchored protein YjiN (DUF445 family)|uniref:DUF445 family protein n=1 Tax=Dialister hominis TaxID=2582419 RepID=UPI0024C52669|nr:DUF445 family protein [uncultured Dialister sp.]UYJ17076.1 MAG: DUF445 domain-containing protein [Veillonellaceae bacterium]